MAEVLVATAISGILLAGAVWMFGQSVDVSTIATLRGDMQQNARVAINLIYRDLLVAGTGLPNGGLQLPHPLGEPPYPQLGCDVTSSLPCWVNVGGVAPGGASALNYYQSGTSNSWLYWVNPQDGQGAQVSQPNASTSGSVDRDPWTSTIVPTDVVTIVYKDNNYPSSWNGSTASSLDQVAATVDISGTPIKVTFDPSTNPAPNDSAYGLNVGDVLFFNNTNGSAVGTVTTVESGGFVVDLNTAGDPLNFNSTLFPVGQQTSGVAGGISSIQNFDKTVSPAMALGTFPSTKVFRVIVVTYYIDNYTYSYPRLMRQVNALPPTPVAQNIENLQFSYDIYDSSAGITCPNIANPFSPPSSCNGGTTSYTPNQISKVNIFVQARAASQRLVGRGYSRVSMISAVSPRNLVFVDRY